VIIGIIDTGCDYLHRNFRDEEGNSRILYLWDQNGTPKTPSLPCGREYDQTTLTQMIQANVNKSYEGLDYQPEENAHGTHVMDIAAGNGKSTGNPGIAPEADLIFVHLSLPTTTQAEEEFLGSSIRLYQAVKYIFDKAELEGKPAVVNISLASNGGPHDGTSLLEKMFDDLLEDQDGGKAIVIAAGNSNLDGVHARGSIESATSSDFHWKIKQRASPDDSESWVQRHEMEIWYESQDSLNLDIYYPKKKSDNPDNPDVEIEKLGTSKRGNTLQESAAGKLFILVHHSFDKEANENHINIFIDDRFTGLKEGEIYDYRFQLTPSTTSQAVEYNAWIERNNDYPSRFAKDEQEFTINSIGNAKLPIVVGAYDNEEAAKPILKSSGSGPSRNSDAPNKPEISAPGVNIFAAGARHYGDEDGKVLTGTSQAAPHVSGVIALMFATARDLNISQIRQILKDTADSVPPPDTPGTDPRRQYGFGLINCLEALNKVLA
jgi:subtilisin family serine protease